MRLVARTFLTFSIALLLFLIPIIYFSTNSSFYKQQFSNNGTYDLFGNRELVDAKGNEIIAFLQGTTSTLDTSFFSQQALHHMQDVRYLFILCHFLTALCFALIFGFFMYFFRKRDKESVANACIHAGTINLTVLLILFLLITFFWTPTFTTFHTTFFSNDLWLFPPTDTLIRLLPNQFFISISYAIGSMTALLSCCTTGAGFLALRKGKSSL